jgi:2-polyprenyl-6-methoxyphenol hydroxylase-like FAD-dependent oxidoreductase
MNILIVGSGIAGPNLAYWLSFNAAHTITILEKAPSLQAHGQNVDIQGTAVTCIRKMGLMPQVQEYTTKELGTRFIDSKGKPFAPLPIKEGSSASPTSEYEILRGNITTQRNIPVQHDNHPDPPKRLFMCQSRPQRRLNTHIRPTYRGRRSVV